MATEDLAAPPSPRKGGRCPAVKAGGMRVSKKLENVPVERSSKFSGKEKAKGHPPSAPGNNTVSSASIQKMQSMGFLLADTLEKLAHKLPPAASQVAHQKPRPTLEKIIMPKRTYIIQQPWKC
ncbi:death-associated protein-like 1 [Pogona vitticeps]|uniref:Death-associated protein-like 1 n=1 Tax=Pogona vitticeps TaxID=103695 RepID=A0A6J0UCD7_9SAUR|nr:death-associated protein-like 1 isoform X1 [Pogona vitticeps]XP_020656821.1 death-associated protein-like 1 isoform X2 [Pogona vitticeps]